MEEQDFKELVSRVAVINHKTEQMSADIRWLKYLVCGIFITMLGLLCSNIF